MAKELHKLLKESVKSLKRDVRLGKRTSLDAQNILGLNALQWVGASGGIEGIQGCDNLGEKVKRTKSNRRTDLVELAAANVVSAMKKLVVDEQTEKQFFQFRNSVAVNLGKKLLE